MKGRAESTPVAWELISLSKERIPDFSVFLSAVHQNYVGTDAEKSPFYLSVVLSDQNNQRVPQYRAILWRKTVSLGPISVPPWLQ